MPLIKSNQIKVEAPLYVTRITSRLSGEAVARARRRGANIFGETLASSIGCTLNALKPSQKLYFIKSPPIRNDPETPRHLLKLLAM